MKNKIIKIEPSSIAEEMGIDVGDSLLSINGKEVQDVIDYRFLMADEYVVVEIEKPNKEVWELEIEKEYDEKLGVEFENEILDSAKSCRNKCIFCFIDQLPKGMRKTLYFKDDDSRLSFLQGNFVTLTNMSDEDIERIIRYRISPINVSVQATNLELRKKMLNNRFADNLMERMNKLARAGIKMNCQVVLCPGINDGKEFIHTIKDLYKLYPSVENVAGVPVGITDYREGLFNMKPYNEKTALKEIENVEPLQKKFIEEIGSPFVRLSDEFYVLSKKVIPETKFYGNFEQFEDGIGMIRTFRDNIHKTVDDLDNNICKSFTMVTGVLAYEEINDAANILMNRNKKLKINVVRVINDFFGKNITVAGLLTGRDIIKYLKENYVGDYVILPRNMLKSDEDIFLDDVKISEVEAALNRKVLICDYSGEDIVNIINKYGKEEGKCQNQ